MLKLRRLKINRYRNVKPCELHFAPGCNAVLGLNGSGKTTLLKLIADLLSKPIGKIALDEARPEAFDIEFELDLPISHAVIKLRRDPSSHSPELRIKAMIALGIRGHSLFEEPHYTADFSMQFNDGNKYKIDQWIGKIRVQLNEEEPILGSHGIENYEILKSFSFAVGSFYKKSSDQNIITLLKEIDQLRPPARFDEALGYFDSIEENRVSRFENPREEIFLEAHNLLPVEYQEFLQTQFDGGKAEYIAHDLQLDFMKKFVRLARLKSAQLKLERIEKTTDQEGNTVNTYGNCRFSFTHRDGSIFPQDHLSYGQKRLLAFLYYLAAEPMVIIADELADGMHYAWLEVCIDAISDRQAILASQNPLVFDHLQFGSAEQVQSSIISCQTVSEGERDALIWRNFTREEAEAFFRAYKAEVQHISEILQTEGLW